MVAIIDTSHFLYLLHISVKQKEESNVWGSLEELSEITKQKEISREN